MERLGRRRAARYKPRGRGQTRPFHGEHCSIRPLGDARIDGFHLITSHEAGRWKPMKVFATSDTHFGHDRLVELSGRPDDFSARIMRGIKESSGDILIHCGDFCIGNDIVWVQAFMDVAKGFKKKILVRGNHDNKSDSWYIERGFDFVCDSFQATYFGKRIMFTHAPRRWELSGGVEMNIHGHMHGNMHRGEWQSDGPAGWHYDLAPEIRNYKPVNIQQIV